MLQKPDPGISATPHANNLRYFNVVIAGPQDSAYDGAFDSPFPAILCNYCLLCSLRNVWPVWMQHYLAVRVYIRICQSLSVLCFILPAMQEQHSTQLSTFKLKRCVVSAGQTSTVSLLADFLRSCQEGLLLSRGCGLLWGVDMLPCHCVFVVDAFLTCLSPLDGSCRGCVQTGTVSTGGVPNDSSQGAILDENLSSEC